MPEFKVQVTETIETTFVYELVATSKSKALERVKSGDLTPIYEEHNKIKSRFKVVQEPIIRTINPNN